MNFYKPYFKKILTLNNVYSYNHKLLKFKRQKWINFLLIYKLKHFSYKKFYKFQITDQYKFLVSKHASKFSNYNNFYSYFFTSLKSVKFLYMKIKQKSKNNPFFINFVENKLNIILIRLKFCLTVRQSKFLVKQGLISLNKYKINFLDYILNSGDQIKLIQDCIVYFKNLVNSNKWPLPSSNTVINYKLKIFLFVRKFDFYCLNFFLPFYLKLKDIF